MILDGIQIGYFGIEKGLIHTVLVVLQAAYKSFMFCVIRMHVQQEAFIYASINRSVADIQAKLPVYRITHFGGPKTVSTPLPPKLAVVVVNLGDIFTTAHNQTHCS